MKYFFVFCWSIFITASVFAQSIERQLIGVSNGIAMDTDFDLEWSVGESITGFYQTDFGLLSEGFIQPEIFSKMTFAEVEQILPVFDQDFAITAFPNPVNDQLTLQMKRPFETRSNIRILDSTGKVFLQEIFPVGMLKKEFNLSALPFGLYLIQIINESNNFQANIKILRIDQ